MYLTAYFTSAGLPATGKSPTITVWTLGGATVVNAQAMTEVAGGFYVYNFAGYDYTEDYVIRAYEATLAPSERYVIGSNDIDSQRSQGIMKQILGLVQSNFRMVNQSYDTSGRLLTANIYTFENATDATNGSPVLHSYYIEAEYDVDGNLSDYMVTDL